MLVVIEGPDGCGKSTIGKSLKLALSALLIEFPDDNAVTGPLIRSYLRKEWELMTSKNVSPPPGLANPSALAFQALQAMNRMERMQEIREVAASQIVVLVRYWQSGWVYGQLDGLDPDWLSGIHETMEQPDVNILLDLSPEESLQRQAGRGEDLERYEGKRDFTEKVVGLYRQLWARKEKEGDARWCVVDASQPIEKVFADVSLELLKRRGQ